MLSSALHMGRVQKASESILHISKRILRFSEYLFNIFHKEFGVQKHIMQISSSICSCLCTHIKDFVDTSQVHMEYECCFSLTITNLFNTAANRIKNVGLFSGSQRPVAQRSKIRVEVKFFPVFFKEEGHIQPVLLQVPLKRCRLHMCVVCCAFGCGSEIACIFR